MESSNPTPLGMPRRVYAAPTADGPTLHRYACLRCRARRVKCDKILSGCINCANHHAECVYSARRPRNTQKPSQGPGTKRLMPSSTFPGRPLALHRRADSQSTEFNTDNTSEDSEQSGDDDEDAIMPRELHNSAYEARNSDRGILLIGPQGTSRYINGEKFKLVASLGTVLMDNTINATIESTREDDRLDASPLLDMSRAQRSFVVHPPSAMMQVMWDYYCQHVDILAKVLYKPAVQKIVTRASKAVVGVHAAESSLLSAIWLATATCMPPNECKKVLGEEKDLVMRTYRQSLEQSLAQAGWTTSQNILVLQSLAIYLVFAHENSRSNWIVSGIALSLAQAMGMHSDGKTFSLNVIDAEVRRRVWWTLCQVDVWFSENCGLESHVPLSMNTELPSQINDRDLELAGERPIQSRKEYTEMTLSVAKIERAYTVIKYKRSTLSKKEKEQIVYDQMHKIEETYEYLDTNSSDLHRLCHIGTRLIIARHWKMLYDASPSDFETDGKIPEESLILYNANILECLHQLPYRNERYGWFFKCKYSQWHATAYLLVQMCRHTQGSTVERVWTVLDAAFASWEKKGIGIDGRGKSGDKTVRKLWQPLLRLLARAREARKQGLRDPQESVSDTPSTLDKDDLASTATPDEAHVSSEIRDGMIGDPFVGSTENLNVDMNWEQIDEWAQNFENDLSLTNWMGTSGAMDWW